MPSLLSLIAVVFAFLSLAFFAASVWGIKKKSFLRMAGNLVFFLLLLSLSALLGTIAIATRGYQALTREEVAAVVKTQPQGPGRFRAQFRFPDGEQTIFDLAGDELYVDAHILKWKPIVNFLGLHTSYELDRVAGRYKKIEDEQSRVRTVFSLARKKPLDMFELRRFYSAFKPLLDVEYGSATFGPATAPQSFELRVSTTGLLLRDTPNVLEDR